MYAIKVRLFGVFVRKTAPQPPDIFLSLSMGSFRHKGLRNECLLLI
jgi:hypothetical protein